MYDTVPVSGSHPLPGTDDDPQRATRNALLRRLPERDLAALAPDLEKVTLKVGDMLAHAAAPIEWVWFLEGALAGLLDVLPDGRRLAVGIIGREGAVGWPLLMGSDRWPWDVVVRAETTQAWRLPAARALEAQNGALHALMLRFGHVVMLQMGRTIVSNLIHPVERRAARWILLYHDRLDGDAITLTHEELSIMLGVRRASITSAMHALEGAGAIRGLRGRIVVRDRKRLEAIAGDTYGPAETEYRRVIG